MPFDLSDKLVIGIASSALFDLEEADSIFKTQGEEAYRIYQRENQDRILDRGVAFEFIKGLLSLNDVSDANPLVEVILLSKNDPDTGFRVFRSIEAYGLPITRAVFLQGKSALDYIPAFNISLFLSGNENDVKAAIDRSYPAGLVVKSEADYDIISDGEIRIAFDFDGVLADDESEKKYQEGGLDAFREHEREYATKALSPGLLKPLLDNLASIQKIENQKRLTDSSYSPKLRIAIVTARNAPAHERVVVTMREWGVMINDAFFLGGVDKGSVMSVLRPHIFFDDQIDHLRSTSRFTPSVHIPFGIKNS
ncbi:5'-nucleotidase [Chromobacterium violaceum]|uniref:5'-nucleotidase n=1 Tax=Chromobacterium violaceum TaxID=536 RepID=UPI0009DA2364|nr:5'-nucleotidase [Chromobacterium violaceum]OQS09960.1 5'-nucleotidase [Chromobacterium violaceum]OQS26095.1 5'-nucleotidase [Chromobacterium violaceum]